VNPGDLVIVTASNELCIVVDVRRDVLGGSSVWSLDGSAKVTHTPRRDQLLLQGSGWVSWVDSNNVKPL
jgi:hypothetical protein